MPKRQQTIDEMMGKARPVTNGEKLKKEDKVMEAANLTEPETSPEIGAQVLEAMRKVREAMYFVSLFHGIDF